MHAYVTLTRAARQMNGVQGVLQELLLPNMNCSNHPISICKQELWDESPHFAVLAATPTQFDVLC